MAHPTHPIATTRRSERSGLRRPGAIRGDRGWIAALPVRRERAIRWLVSSPRGRGISVLYDLYRLGDRSIPACAGELLGNSLPDQPADRLGAGRRVLSCLDPFIEKSEVIGWKADGNLRRVNSRSSSFSRIRYCISHY